MAISGQETIQVGIENQAVGADSIFTAFNKTQNNFARLFQDSSPYVNYVAGNGIQTNKSGNTVTITNTGVINIIPGTGVTVLKNGTDVTISASGGNGVSGVTNVGISSTTLSITNSPVISAGIMSIDLPTIPVNNDFSPGSYTAPILEVDEYGRITSIANSTNFGTVTSIAVQASGDGISITGSPITNSGTVSIKNTGVTKINAGSGIALSGATGEVTISSTQTATGTVTRVDVQSNTLVITNSPITTDGTIQIDIPNNVTLTGYLTANSLGINTTANVDGNVNAGNLKTTGLVLATGNVTGGNLATGGVVSATGNIVGANLIGNSLVQGATIRVAGSRSVSAWGTTGVGLVTSSATYTDTTTAGSGSVANAHIHVVSTPTVNSSNASVTVGKSATWYISGAPIAGGNVTITNPYALQVAAGVVQIDSTTVSTSNTTGALRVAGGVGIGGNLNVQLNTNVDGNISVTGNISTANVIVTVDNGLTANGTTQATALLLSKHVSVIGTCGSGANGVLLPTGVTGTTLKVVNNTSENLNVYPAVGCRINQLTSNLPIVLSANTQTVLTATDPNRWFTF